MHTIQKMLQLGFVKDTGTLSVYLLELLSELAQEFFVLHQLVGKDRIDKLTETDPTLKFDLLPLGVLLVPCQLSCWLHATD